MTYADLRKTRIQLIRRHHPLDSLLIEVGKKYSSHSFLANPAGQNVFLYLTNLVVTISTEYFKKKFSELKVVDWGCGKGHVTYLLQTLGGNIISCDIEQESSDSSFGQETPIIETNGIEILPLKHEYILPFQDNSVDIFLSFGVLEHVTSDNSSIREISRVLNKNGLFFCFNLPYLFSWTQRLAHLRGDYYHNKLYSRGEVKRLINSNDMEILDLWHRQLFPKNSVKYPIYGMFEKLDQLLTEYTPLKYLSTNIEFIARKL